MTKAGHPTHEQLIDSAEHFYGLRVTADRQFIIQRSVTCLRDPIEGHRWCQLAHEGKAYGNLFWCDCPCHTAKEES